MVPVADPVVDWRALADVVIYSLGAGIGVTAIFALSILGATRAVDLRRDGHSGAAVAYGALMLVAFAAVAAAVVGGILVMTQK